MLTLNRKLLLCARHRQILQCLVANHWSQLNNVKFVTCSVLLKKNKKENISFLVTPVPFKDTVQLPVGSELAGNLNKAKLLKVITSFIRSPEVKSLSEENGLDDYLVTNGFSSFRSFCLETENLPPELHIVLSDIINGHGKVMDIFPYFLKHVRERFPHLECMDELKKIGDIRFPANWYPEARAMKRKFIFHCGPTNSGKTHHAIKNFVKSKSGVYCAPLKLLAVEIFTKSNDLGTPCDLVTGEEVIFVNPSGDPSNHVSCTVEMVSLENEYDVAVIDEVQMIRDQQRGWAWTRALLGLKAKEIHICGEEAAVSIVDTILCSTSEDLEVKNYRRLTKLQVVPPVKSFSNVKPGDCIVCFTKSDIYFVTKSLEKLNVELAVIYGSLPPGTKIVQCNKFNDPNNPCKVLVATDAVGMGLNLSIRRIIFYSLIKPKTSEGGIVEMDYISVSQTLQIGGRAGRYGTCFDKGYVTTFHEKDMPVLEKLMSETPEPVLSAGLVPTQDLIELYSYYLPNSPLCKLIEIFVKLSTLDDSIYFMCDMRNIIYLAQMIEHIQMPLSTKFTFCCAPIDKKLQYTCSMFVKFAKLYSENKAITFHWLTDNIGWPLEEPRNIQELIKCEEVHHVLDLYLWFSNRFPQYFPDGDEVKKIQLETENLVQVGVFNLTKLLNQEERLVQNSMKKKNEGRRMKSNVEFPKFKSMKDTVQNLNNDIFKEEKKTLADKD